MSLTITNQDSFWNEIENTLTTYSPNNAVFVQQKKVADNAKSMQTEMFNACDKTHFFAIQFFSIVPPQKVLDLGSGKGMNTLPMAACGSHVTAIDNSMHLLQEFSNRSTAIGCPSTNLRLRHADITTMASYDGPFNLVMAIDILPYIPPKALRSTMEKIHKCLEHRGILIGTLFTKDQPSIKREFMEQLGAHFYGRSQEFITQFLQYSGFKPLEIQEEVGEGIFYFKAEKIPLLK